MKETLRKIESSEGQKVLVVINNCSGPLDEFSLSSRLEKEIARALRYQHFLSLIVLALELPASGMVLPEIIPLLKENLRKVDLISFYEKDNLILLLPETSKEGALSLSGRLKKEIESANFSRGIKAKVRLGMACYPTEASSGKELLEKSFRALKADKSSPRRESRAEMPPPVFIEN